MGAYYAPRSDVISYEEFRVVLAKEREGQYSSAVVASPVGESPDKNRFTMPFKPREIEQALSSGLHQSIQRSGLAGDTLDPVKDLGARLFAALFDSRLQRMYSEALARADGANRGLRLRLVITCEELATLPWEFLFDVSGRQDFISLFVRSPVVRQAEAEPPRLEPFTPPLRVLFVMADITGRLEVQAELDRLEAVRKASPGMEMDVDTIQDATPQAFIEALRRKPYHVVHFSGTGVTWGARSGHAFEEQALVLMNPDGGKPSPDVRIENTMLVNAEQLREALDRQNELRLLYFSACKTDALAWRLAPSVPAVIGMRGDPTVDDCISFTDGLYTALLAGQPLDAAVSLGRERMSRQSPGMRDWGLPTFYMQSADGALVDAGAPAAKGILAPSYATREVQPTSEDRQRKVLEARIERYKRAVQALQAEAERTGGQTSAMLDDEIKANQAEMEKAKAQLEQLG